MSHTTAFQLLVEALQSDRSLAAKLLATNEHDVQKTIVLRDAIDEVRTLDIPMQEDVR